MKRIKGISLFLIGFLIIFSGCATFPSREKMALEVSGYNLPKQSEANDALIYIVRPSSLGFIVRFNVFLDNKEDNSEMGYTRGSQYIYFYTNPGQHTIYSKAENWAEISVNVKAGETIFLKQSPAVGILFARNSIELLEDVEGKYNVKNTKIGTIIRDRK